MARAIDWDGWQGVRGGGGVGGWWGGAVPRGGQIEGGREGRGGVGARLQQPGSGTASPPGPIPSSPLRPGVAPPECAGRSAGPGRCAAAL